MVTRGRRALLAAVALLAVGCIDVEELLKLNADGSGRGRMTVRMNPMVAGFAGAAMAQLEAEVDKAKAAGLIESWELVEDESLPTGERRMVMDFRFADVNRLGELSLASLSFGPGERRWNGREYGFSGSVSSGAIEPGGSYTLTIEFPGKIAQTNGSRQGGSRVTWSFAGGSGGALSATVTRRSLSPMELARGLWQSVEEWLDRDAVAVRASDGFEIRAGGSVVERLETGGYFMDAAGPQVVVTSPDALVVWEAAGAHRLEGLAMSGVRVHPDGGLAAGVTLSEGDFGGIVVVDLETAEERALTFETPTYYRPRLAWFGDRIAHDDPESGDGLIRLWSPADGTSEVTRCAGILMGAGGGELLLAGRVYADHVNMFGPLRWCDPATGRGARVSAKSSSREVLAISPSGERLALVRADGVLVTGRDGSHQRVFRTGEDLELAPGEEPSFVRWSAGGERLLAGYAAWDGEAQLAGPAWVIDLESGERRRLEAVRVGAFVEWPRWPGVSRPLLRSALYLTLGIAALALALLVAWLARRLLPRLRALKPPSRRAFCPGCGARLAPGARFCRECGATATPPPVSGRAPASLSK